MPIPIPLPPISGTGILRSLLRVGKPYLSIMAYHRGTLPKMMQFQCVERVIAGRTGFGWPDVPGSRHRGPTARLTGIQF